ncbi:hypothetical protein DIPPA_65917 [Diplonema papillatum]|nr:hypothetical protein DIPPA_65917 [Diplonema papillatum]
MRSGIEALWNLTSALLVTATEPLHCRQERVGQKFLWVCTATKTCSRVYYHSSEASGKPPPPSKHRQQHLRSRRSLASVRESNNAHPPRPSCLTGPLFLSHRTYSNPAASLQPILVLPPFCRMSPFVPSRSACKTRSLARLGATAPRGV